MSSMSKKNRVVDVVWFLDIKNLLIKQKKIFFIISNYIFSIMSKMRLSSLLQKLKYVIQKVLVVEDYQTELLWNINQTKQLK